MVASQESSLRVVHMIVAMVVTWLATTGMALAGDRLIATSGVSQIEGAAGGGLVPWAVIAGYGTRDQFGITTLD